MILREEKGMEEVRRSRQPVGIGTKKTKPALDADQEGLVEFLLLALILIRTLEKRFLHPLWNLTLRTPGVKEIINAVQESWRERLTEGAVILLVSGAVIGVLVYALVAIE
jgi:hypothetical protein